MTRPRTVRRILWMALALVVPAPFFLAQTGLVPVARIFMLGVVTLAIIAAEGSRGAVGTAAVLLFAQAAFYLILFWFAARALARLLARLPGRIGSFALTFFLIGILCAGTFRIYRDPFGSRSLRTNLLHVFE